MKKLIQWLAKAFNANIKIEKIIYEEKIIYRALDSTLPGDVAVEGNLTVDGFISASKDIVCYKTKTE